MSLTIDELKEKIKQAEADINLLSSQGTSGRKFEVLNEYKKYLEEELEILKNSK